MPDCQQASEWIDPRIRRTREMLLNALERLLEAKNIEQISVADITDTATLNRATFYDHYTDKFALLDGLVELRFQDLLNRRNVIFDGSCPSAIIGITLATCDYLAGLTGGECADRRQMEKHLESAIIAVVRGMILCGLQRHPAQQALPPEMVAAAVSGAIYGAAREWVRTTNRPPADEVAQAIFALIAPMLASPQTLLQHHLHTASSL